MSDSTTVVQWGRQADCEAEGCDPPHDDPAVYRWHSEGGKTVPPPSKVDRCPPVNGHAMRWVQRFVTTTPWAPADPKEARYA